jgi:hypothetical protein
MALVAPQAAGLQRIEHVNWEVTQAMRSGKITYSRGAFGDDRTLTWSAAGTHMGLAICEPRPAAAAAQADLGREAMSATALRD